MASSQGKVWYINNATNKIYRVNDFGYTMDTQEKMLLLKDISNGTKWIIPYSELHKQVLIHDKPTALWEEMPEGWHPVGEEKRYALDNDQPYPGYTNDPRKDVNNYGYNENAGRNCFRGAASNYARRGYIGFKR